MTIFSLMSVGWGCDEGYTEIDGECYYQGDLDVLQQFIDNSSDTINMNLDINNNGVIEPLELGEQIWINGRIISLECMGDYGEALLNVKNVFLQCSQLLINKLNLILGDKTRVIDKGDLLLVICDNLLEDNTLNFLSSMIISIPYYNNKTVIVKNSNINGYDKLIIRQNHLSTNKNLLNLLNKIKSDISIHGNDCVVSCIMKSDYYETFIKNVEEVLI